MTTFRNWRIYNQRLVDRGRIVIDVLVDSQLMDYASIRKMNEGKAGRRFEFSPGLISAAFAVKCILRLGYREVAGFVSRVCDRLHRTSPNFRTIWWRIDRMKNEGVKFGIQEGKHRIVAIDSTGLRPVNDGEYRAMKYDLRKEWIKLHAVVDVETNEILNVKITKGNAGDNPQFRETIKPIAPNVSTVFADKAYDSVETFNFCAKEGIFTGVPVKFNATNSSGKSRPRRDAIEEQLGYTLRRGKHGRIRYITKEDKIGNQESWKLKVGYGRRSLVESAFSRYKRVLGEALFSRKPGNIEKEIVARVNILNRFATN